MTVQSIRFQANIRVNKLKGEKKRSRVSQKQNARIAKDYIFMTLMYTNDKKN